MAIVVVHREIMIMFGMIPIRSMMAPKSGAPGRIARTEGRANRAVRQTPRISISYKKATSVI
jgi:hypothetical protein